MTITRKILLMMTALSIVVVLFSFIGFNLGYDGLLLVGEMHMPHWVCYFVMYLFFSVQFFMAASIIAEEYSRKILRAVLPFLVAYPFLCEIVPTFIMTGVAPFVYMLLFSVFGYRKSVKRTVLNVLKIYAAIAIFEGLTLIVKTGKFALGYNTLSQYEFVMWSIDLIIFVTILYSIGGERYVVLGSSVNEHWRKFNLRFEAVQRPALDAEDKAEIDELKKLVGFKRVRAVAVLLGFQVLQWTLILFICALGNVFLEGLAITSSFVAHGFIIKRRWHSNSIIVCTLSSAAMFYVSAKAIPSFGYTQLFPIIVGVLLLYAMFRVAMYADESKAACEELARLRTKKPFKCDKATEEEFRARCHELGKNDEYIRFCLLAWRSGKTRKEVADELFLAETTVKEYKRIRKKELETE